ncbi:DNA recombination protein RmuC [Marivibrio halodurans]|uniref:DNA recombination protein RmuC homolog n=1 Tax=Marivibrio halodurans TaxID=2039722 RepID=A0A8J7SNG1_9PROT|nr:DNA recombination protein RmuC [Marivibrio halodurans]MBP5857988.1 DNA recombination protein RmuC [Marivibrio halodurans]
MAFEVTMEMMLAGALLAGVALGAALALLARPPGRARAAEENARALADQLHAEQLAHGETRVRLEETARARAEGQERLSMLESRVEARERTIAEKDTAIARVEQRLKDQEQAIADFEKLKQDFLAIAKSSVTATASELSTKLLNDHKQENELSRKQSEERTQKLTADLLKQVDELGQRVVRIDEVSRHNADDVSTVLRALSAPGTSGHAAQTTLGNVLKSFGLTEGRDYHLEYTVTGTGEDGAGRLRPDAVVFLPSDTVLVIDSKSSKYLLELAEAEDEGEEALAAARKRFTESMRKHLADLTRKDYRKAVSEALQGAGRRAEARQVLTLMWLPNEGAVEKLGHADPTFTAKAAQADIFVTGPSGLWSAVGIATTRIRLQTQHDNAEVIRDLATDLVDRLTTALSHAEKVGNAITQAAKGYDDFAGSMNRRVLPVMKSMGGKGLSLPAKGLPGPLPKLDVRKDAIDAESEPVDEAPLLFGPEDGEKG